MSFALTFWKQHLKRCIGRIAGLGSDLLKWDLLWTTSSEGSWTSVFEHFMRCPSVLFTSRGHGRLGLLGKGWQPIGWPSECEGGAEYEISRWLDRQKQHETHNLSSADCMPRSNPNQWSKKRRCQQMRKHCIAKHSCFLARPMLICEGRNVTETCAVLEKKSGEKPFHYCLCLAAYILSIGSSWIFLFLQQSWYSGKWVLQDDVFLCN